MTNIYKWGSVWQPFISLKIEVVFCLMQVPLMIKDLFLWRYGSRYSTMDQLKFVEDSLSKIWSDMVCLSNMRRSWSYHFLVCIIVKTNSSWQLFQIKKFRFKFLWKRQGQSSYFFWYWCIGLQYFGKVLFGGCLPGTVSKLSELFVFIKCWLWIFSLQIHCRFVTAQSLRLNLCHLVFPS